MHTVQQQGNTLNQSPNYSFEPLLSDAQAAELLSIHPKTLQRLAREGAIPAHRIGRYWRYRASELDNWLNSAVHSGQPIRSREQEKA